MTDWRVKNGVSASTMVLPHFAKDQKPPSSLLFYLERLGHNLWGQNWEFRLKNGLIFTDNGLALPPDALFVAGQRIYYWRDAGDEPRIPFEERIVYEDGRILVADKPHFLPVTPSGRYVQETLLVRLKTRTGLVDLTPIHRIDRDTAGLVLFCKIASLRGAYMKLFREQHVQKTYECIAPLHALGGARHDFPLIRKTRLEGSTESFMQMQETQGLPNTETLIECIEMNHESQLARYQLTPKTGKRHQLRVHMNALGLPILNDGIYPQLLPEPELSALSYAAPLQLLAKRLELTDPMTEQTLVFESQFKLFLNS